MRKITSILAVLLGVVFIIGLAIFGLSKSKRFQDFIFYKSGLIPNEIFVLNEKINLSSPTNISADRLNLFQTIDDFIKNSVSGNGFSAKVYSLVKIRLDKAFNEITDTNVSQGSLKLWYLYNMGVVVKSSDKTIAFDLPSRIVYVNVGNLTNKLDVLIITHFHGDHFDPTIIKEALKNGVSVVVPNDNVALIQNGSSKIIVRDPNGENIIELLNKLYGIKSDNLIAVNSSEKVIVKGIGITGYAAKHMYNPDSNTDPNIAISPIDWFYVDIDGVGLLDAGDSSTLISEPDFGKKKIDIFIAHIDDARTNDSLANLVTNAKIILPLHVIELQHGSGILNYMMYKNVLDANFNGYWKNNLGTKFTPLVWGESLLIK
jgi:hypothetical protein